jgi:hypothetical protein
MRKPQIAIIALTVWITLVSILILLFQRIDYEIFVVFCLMGTFVILQLMQSNFVQPRYLRYIRYFTAAGIVIFLVIVAKKVIENLIR